MYPQSLDPQHLKYQDILNTCKDIQFMFVYQNSRRVIFFIITNVYG